jgi:hypothetical protein
MSEEPKTKFDSDKGKFQFTSLTNVDRENLVELSKEAFIEVEKLELSALGANAELHGDWPNPKIEASLESWKDTGSYGRTMHSVTVHRGYLFPLGHRATMTTIIQRVVAVEPGNDNPSSGETPVAYLQAIKFIKVAETVKIYGAVGQPFVESAGGASDWPFASVRMVTLVSPDVTEERVPVSKAGHRPAFWPIYENDGNEEAFPWKFVATDLAGNDITFEMPLIFVQGGVTELGNTTAEEYETGPGSWSEELVEKYLQAQGGSHQTWSQIGGAPLRFAPEVAVDGGDAAAGATTHPTLLIVLGAATSTKNENASTKTFSGPGSTVLQNAGQPNFYPTIASARIRLHAADALLGKDFSDENGSPPGGRPAVGGVEFKYFPQYVTSGSSSYGAGADVVKPDSAGGTAKPDGLPALPNPGSVYAETVNNVALNLPSSAVGALGTPNATIVGLSGAIGAVGGELRKVGEEQIKSLENYAQNAAAKVGEYFKGAGNTLEEAEEAAKKGAEAGAAALSELLGGLKLANILADLGAASGAVRDPSRAVRPADEGGESGFQTPTISSLTDPSSGPPTVKYKLHTALKKWPESAPVFVPEGEPGYLTLLTEVVKGLDGSPPTYNVEGSIDPFSICLLGDESSTYFLKLHFESLTFTAGSGGKPSVHVNLDEVKFEGALEFVNALEEFLESLGGEGLAVHVEPTKIKIGTSITLPPVEVGILTLSGLGFNGSVEIPFISGTAIATFGFASKENPFTLTVVMFGGGGFVAVSVGFGGVQSVELQFDFTGRFGFDIVVASGSLSLVAGIYIKYEVAHGGLFLEGFVRVTGQLEVLGIISISAELILSLTYETESGEATGTATLKAHFSVFGFGASVEITMTKSFAGSGGGAHSALRQASARALVAGSDGVRPADKATETGLTWENLMPKADWETYVKAFNALSPPT